MTRQQNEIGRLFGEGTLAALTDAQLLERFVSRGDGEAFEAIVARHGLLVLAACRSGLGAFDGAEDAFQATFLVLVRRAGTFPVRDSLAGWLYRVARRVARQARIEANRRVARERKATDRTEFEPARDHARDEIHRLIHEELAQLPERYRSAIQLCDLHGLTRDEAAEALGCPPGTIAGRLARARQRLRARLERRGVDTPSAWPIALGEIGSLIQRAARASIAASKGLSVASSATRLASSASRSLLLSRIPTTLALLAAITATGVATTVLAFRSEGRPPLPPTPSLIPKPLAIAQVPVPPPIDPDDPATADLFAGKVIDPAGQPIAGAKIYLVPDYQASNPGEVRAVTAADGRFRFSAKDATLVNDDGLRARRSSLLIASAEGRGPAWVNTWGQTRSTFRSHFDPIKTAEWTLTLPLADPPIRGRLLDPEGRPLVGAVVTLEGLQVPRSNNLDAHLEKLTSPAAAFLMPDFEAVLYRTEFLPGLTTRAVTDGDGRFRIDGIGRDQLASIGIKGPGVVDTSITVMTREAPDAVAKPLNGPEQVVVYGAGFTLKLRPGRSLKVLVRDKETHEPLPNVWVGYRKASIAGLNSGRYPDATDAQGRFTINGLDPNLDNQEVLAVPKPGLPYFLGQSKTQIGDEVIVDCPRGIPYRLMVRDEAGRPVEAQVAYSAIMQNEYFRKKLTYIEVMVGSPLSRGARQPDGSYLGVALPGPGAITVKTAKSAGYRHAHVDPKGFFAPGRTEWTAQERITSYGTHDTLSVATMLGGAWEDQHDYSAIVLIKPPDDPKPLELSATVVRDDPPRPVKLVDLEGKLVSNVETEGMTNHPWDAEPMIRSGTFLLKDFHPDRSRRITFLQNERKLIGFLMVKGIEDTPNTIVMRPWATVTGRIVGENGEPLVETGTPGKSQAVGTIASDSDQILQAETDAGLGIIPATQTDPRGRFRIEKIVPGQSCTARIFMGNYRKAGTAFQNLKLEPGEVREIGDIRLAPEQPAKPKP